MSTEADAIARALLEGFAHQISETEAKVLAEAVEDLVLDCLAFRRGRRVNGHVNVQVNIREAKPRGHETASRRVG